MGFRAVFGYGDEEAVGQVGVGGDQGHAGEDVVFAAVVEDGRPIAASSKKRRIVTSGIDDAKHLDSVVDWAVDDPPTLMDEAAVGRTIARRNLCSNAQAVL